MVDRIIELMKQKNLTPSQFADEIGIQRSGMSHLLSGRNKPSLEFVLKVLNRFPDVRPDFLLLGTERSMAGAGDTRPLAADEPAKVVQPEKTVTTLFDQFQETGQGQQEKAPVVPRKERNERRIEKIVVFYSDQTFRAYLPG